MIVTPPGAASPPHSVLSRGCQLTHMGSTAKDFPCVLGQRPDAKENIAGGAKGLLTFQPRPGLLKQSSWKKPPTRFPRTSWEGETRGGTCQRPQQPHRQLLHDRKGRGKWWWWWGAKDFRDALAAPVIACAGRGHAPCRRHNDGSVHLLAPAPCLLRLLCAPAQ